MLSRYIKQFILHKEIINNSLLNASDSLSQNDFHQNKELFSLELNSLKETITTLKTVLDDDCFELNMRIGLLESAIDNCVEYIQMKELPTFSSIKTVDSEISEVLMLMSNC